MLAAASRHRCLEQRFAPQPPGEPVFLTVGVRSQADPRLLVRRAGLAVVFALGVRLPQSKPAILTGEFKWAAFGLDDPGHRHDRTWIDFNTSRERAEALLKSRIYHVGEPS